MATTPCRPSATPTSRRTERISTISTAYIKTSMPRDEPGSLDDHKAIDVVAYLLQRNALPAGAEELPPDPEMLQRILTVKQAH